MLKTSKSLAIVAVIKLVIITTTYLAEKSFRPQLTSKPNRETDKKIVDELMRRALKELILPRPEKHYSTN